MSQAELMNEGLSLMMFGMGFVFIFLTVLVFATSLMSKTVLAMASEEPEPAPQRSVPAAGTSDPASDPLLLAVIGDAIRQHRERRR